MGEKTASRIFRELLEALVFLHDQGVAHMDLKPENIVFQSRCGGVALFTAFVGRWARRNTTMRPSFGSFHDVDGNDHQDGDGDGDDDDDKEE